MILLFHKMEIKIFSYKMDHVPLPTCSKEYISNQCAYYSPLYEFHIKNDETHSKSSYEVLTIEEKILPSGILLEHQHHKNTPQNWFSKQTDRKRDKFKRDNIIYMISHLSSIM